jgi:hypothetical protein
LELLHELVPTVIIISLLVKARYRIAASVCGHRGTHSAPKNGRKLLDK